MFDCELIYCSLGQHSDNQGDGCISYNYFPLAPPFQMPCVNLWSINSLWTSYVQCKEHWANCLLISILLLNAEIYLECREKDRGKLRNRDLPSTGSLLQTPTTLELAQTEARNLELSLLGVDDRVLSAWAIIYCIPGCTFTTRTGARTPTQALQLGMQTSFGVT